MLRLQILAIAVAAASILFVHAWLGAIIPPRTLLVFDAIMGGFIAWWIVSIGWLRATRRVVPDTPDAWYWHTSQVFWFGNAATISTFWLALPYGSEAMRLMVTMMCLAPVTVEVIGTIRPPKFGPRDFWSTVVPLGIPIGLCLWFAFSSDEFRVPVLLFLASFTAVMLLLREVVQGSVNEAWRAKQVAEAARDARTRFLASASHDLGQPLQAARLFFDQAMANPVGPARDAAARGLNWAFDTTETLLGQMLDHLRLESGQMAVRIEALTLGPVIAQLAEIHEPAARLAHVDIIAVPTRLAVTADRALLDRALGNFVTNALRHAHARRLLIGARWTAGRVRIWVIDDGTGIPAADMARLFDDHFQGSNHGDEVRGGFGLGLASTRRLAELMHGSAGIDRRWTRGSAFWLELPAA
jgi:signal transduction histidine kinase